MRGALLPSLLIASILAWPACVVVPVRLSTRTKDTTGNEQQLDFTFLKAGTTTRDEVVKNLAVIDTHINQLDIFWGRWESSNWGVGGFVALPPIGGGAGGQRVWAARNIFVRFTPAGVVSDWTLVEDKELVAELQQLSAAGHQELTYPAQASVNVILYSKNKPSPQAAELSFTESDFACSHSAAHLACDQLQTPRSNIKRIEIVDADPAFSKDRLGALLHFSAPVRDGRYREHKITLGVDAPTLWMVVRYLNPEHPPH